jgi:hypothetical protein
VERDVTGLKRVDIVFQGEVEHGIGYGSAFDAGYAGGQVVTKKRGE